MGTIANRRKSFNAKSKAAAAQTPTSALRVNVSATAAPRAGNTRAAHVRSPRPNRTRAIAMPMTVISSPEYVIQ